MITKQMKGTSSGTVTITAPTFGAQCIVVTELNVYSDAGCTITVQSPSGTTVWTTQIPAGGGGYADRWTEINGPKGAAGQAVVIAVSAGTYTISYRAVIVE